MMTPRSTLRLPGLAAGAMLLLAAFAAQAQLIGTIQGRSHVSPLANAPVSGILGIVTAVDGNGFWMQDGGDGDDLTSDAVYVFRGSAGSKPAVGDAVTVRGQVQEFRPGNNAGNLTTTQINATGGFAGGWTLVSKDNPLPAARVIDLGFLPPATIAPAVGNVETAAGYTLQPQSFSMDFYESLEGMRVALPAAQAVAPTNRFGEIALVASAQVGSSASVWTPRGGVALAPGNFNGQRLYIDDRLRPVPQVNVGAQLAGVVGVLDYSFSNYKLYVTETPTVVSDTLQRQVASIAPGRLGLASYNVLNLGGDASDARMQAIATQLRANLGAPHLVALQEVMDNDGTTNSGTVAADLTLNRLAAALNAQTGRHYAWVAVDPVDGADGGVPGGNIRNAYLYDSSRISFAGVVGGAMDAITASASPQGQIVLNLGAGRIDPANAAWAASRKPLVTEFTVDGQQLIVINNHFNSKGGDQPLYGPSQPPVRGTETQRLAQAQAVASFVQGLLAINPHANIVVTGDFNDFQFADTLAPLTAAGLTNLTMLLPEGERYTYNFEGNSQALDHMFVSANLLGKGDLAYQVVRANSEFFDQVSDHDPLLLTLGLVPAPVPEPGTLALLVLGLAAIGRAARRQG
jgi:predicted extracellular nuclease